MRVKKVEKDLEKNTKEIKNRKRKAAREHQGKKTAEESMSGC